MKAPPGGELACRAHDNDFDAVRHGVVSYYATSTVVQSANFQSWVNLIEQRSGEDLAHHKITLLHKPMLQICGNPSTKLPGEPRG